MGDVALAPATVGRGASKERMVEPPEERVQTSNVNLARSGPLRGLVEFLARAFAFTRADDAVDADTKEHVRRTCSHVQRF